MIQFANFFDFTVTNFDTIKVKFGEFYRRHTEKDYSKSNKSHYVAHFWYTKAKVLVRYLNDFRIWFPNTMILLFSTLFQLI